MKSKNVLFVLFRVLGMDCEEGREGGEVDGADVLPLGMSCVDECALV